MKFSRELNEAKRFEQVFRTLMKYELGFLVKKGLKIEKTNPDINEPVIIRKIIEELGGSFVKLGQFLSLRPDLIPIKYCDEFAKLQDDVKPFSFEEAKKLIENSTGKSVKNIFSSFNKKVLASASIGQVYRAKLKNGDEVAVKVRRPGIEELMEADLDILTNIAKQSKKYLSYEIADPECIVEELRSYTVHELDYMHETMNVLKFYKSFKNTSVKIPKPYKELCSDKIVVMEFIEGVKLNNYLKKKAPLKKRKEIADEIINAFFKQVFIDGIFHADPHPGNILVLNKAKYPHKAIAFLDFGITGEVTEEVKNSLLHLFIALIDKDVEKIITAMSELHLVDANSPDLRKDMKNMLGPYYGVSLNKINVPKLFIQSMKVAKKNNIKIPADYVLLGKAMITLESVCSVIYPEFNFVESAKPFIAGMATYNFSPRKLASKSYHRLISLKDTIEEIPKVAKQYLERSEQQEKYMKELNEHVEILDSQIKQMMDRLIMIGCAFILMLGGYFLKDYPPVIDGFPIVSTAFIIVGLIIILFAATSGSFSKH